MQRLVISLEKATERRKHISNEFGKQNINYDFFDALTPDLAEPLAKKMGLNIQDQLLSKGELACFMSHVSIWQKMVDEHIHYLAIFEDDVFLGENANIFLNDNSWIKNYWGVIKLEAFSRKVWLAKCSEKLNFNREIIQLKGRHVGGAGYILSLSFAQYLLHLVKTIEVTEPLDHILFDPKYHQQLNLYQMNQALCIQSYLYDNSECFTSSLELQRIERRGFESSKRTFRDKIIREVKRLYSNILNVFCKKEVWFK